MKTNRLSQETSPYLKQHQHNPVDWYPWGEEALEKARKENLPILLSVGYSACHWCHVMAHECFEDEAVARLMNENFVNIKVDREERPDLDQIYQNVAQIFTRGGGWPLTVFMTPDLRPFFGGTYFPPEDRYGRPGFPRLLKALSDAFRNEKGDIESNAARISELIGTLEEVKVEGEEQPSFQALGGIERKLLSYTDRENGGFGSAPKFPNPMLLSFLWRSGLCSGDPEDSARKAVVFSLEKMVRGGIYDQLGGGFSRYSVDDRWSVPHFEKMLYDNALLLKLYSEALLTDRLRPVLREGQRELFAARISETVAFVKREMLDPTGRFYSALDADSEGEEGKYYVWSEDELRRGLTEKEFEIFSSSYGVTKEGGFEGGTNVLFLARTPAETSRELGIPLEEIAALIATARSKLDRIRARRVRPGLDDKTLVSWSALMISGLSWAGRALEEVGLDEPGQEAREMALTAFRFLKEKTCSQGGRLSSTYQGGQARFNGYLDDYAFMAMAALDLARFSLSGEGVRAYLQDSLAWVGQVRARFSDPGGAGYFFTSDDHEKLLHRPKAISDQAIPSGTAVALECMIALAEIDLDGQGAELAQEAEIQLRRIFPLASKNPYGSGEILLASLLSLLSPVVLSGSGSREFCVHPHFFRKEGSGDLLICHRRSCLPPIHGKDQALEALSRFLEKS